MSQGSSQRTEYTNQQKNFSNLNHFTSATEWRHLLLSRLSVIYNVYTMQNFNMQKKETCCSGNSGCFVLRHSQLQIILSPLPPSFRFMKPLGMQVETYSISVKTMKTVFVPWVEQLNTHHVHALHKMVVTSERRSTDSRGFGGDSCAEGPASSVCVCICHCALNQPEL